jgi:hypothetical protein
VAVSCKDSNESSGSIKDREFVDQLSDCVLLKDSALWSWIISQPVSQPVT